MSELSRALAPTGRLMVSGIRFLRMGYGPDTAGAYGLTIAHRMYTEGRRCLAFEHHENS